MSTGSGGRAPHVVLLMGLPGAGKSRLARHLVARLPLCLVDRDHIRGAMFPGCAFTEAEKQAANEAVLAAVRANCRTARHTLVDGWSLARADDREALRRTANMEGGTVVPLLLELDPDTARRRVAADTAVHPAGDRGPDLVDEVAARFDPPSPDTVIIDARADAETVQAHALDAVRRMLETS